MQAGIKRDIILTPSLTIAQGSEVEWEGVSGSAVLDEGRVVALITNVTHKAATAWAAPMSALRRLQLLHELLGRAKQALVHLYGEQDRRPAQLAGADHARATALLDDARRDHPDAGNTMQLAEELGTLVSTKTYVGMPAEQLAELQHAYAVVAERDGGQRFRPNPTDEFSDIFLANSRFGGRKEELGRLDRFAALELGGYVFVTGTSGYGKTSLLARWSEARLRRGEPTCFHFFNGRIPESLDPQLSLTKLCEQLLALHRVGGELPRERLQLQSLYARLLSLPAPEGRPLVIVLDGLDEVLETLRPGPALFPSPPGPGVHVVFSARATGKDWLADLRLQLDKDHVLNLGQLERDDIVEILTRAGLPVTEAVLDLLVARTHGDPFYVEDVVRALIAVDGDVGVLEHLPARHSAYLQQWWNEGVKRVTRPGFLDLMGTLAALRAPLGDGELTAVSRDDELKPGTIGVLLEDAQRYVEYDSRRRYWLRHDRIRQFVRDTLGDDMEAYRQRVTAYALRWNDPKTSRDGRDYGRRYAIVHLLEADRFREALAMLDPELLASKWREEGSYRSVLGDFDALLEWVSEHPLDRDAVCAAPAIAVANASARGLMGSLSDDAYRSLLRLDGRSKVSDLLDPMLRSSSEVTRPLLAVADEALRMAQANEAGAADRSLAAELLGRTIGLLPLILWSGSKVEVLAEVCSLLAGGQLEGREVDRLFRQALAAVDGIEAPVLRATCLAHLGRVVTPGTRSAAEKALLEAESLASGFELAVRFHIHVCALAAHRTLRPGMAATRILEDLRELPGGDTLGFSLASTTLHDLLTNWCPVADERDALVAIAQRVLGEGPIATQWSILGPLALALYRTGHRDLAGRFIVWALSISGAEVLLKIFPALTPEDRLAVERSVKHLYTRYEQGERHNLPALGEALACIGRWPECLEVLTHVPGQEFLPVAGACIGLALALPDDAERERVLDRLLSMRSDRLAPPRIVVAAEGSAEFAARVALVLARAEHPRAREFLRQAIAPSLSLVPGDDGCDSLRLMVAVALAAEGKLESAERVSRSCMWMYERIASLLASARALPVDLEGQRRFALALADVLASASQGDLLHLVLSEACGAVIYFAPSLSAEARLILDCAERRLDDVYKWEWARCRIDTLRARVALDPATGPAAADEAIWILENREDPVQYEVLLQAGQLAVSARTSTGLGDALARVRAVAERATGVAKRVEAMCAYAAALAEIDGEKARVILGRQIAALDEVVADSPAERDVHERQRLFDEPLWGPETPPEVESLEWILSAGTCVPAGLGPAGLEELLQGAWTWIARTDTASPAHRPAAARSFFESLATLPAAEGAIAGRLAERAALDLVRLLPETEFDKLMADVAHGLAARGMKEAAEVIRREIRDLTRREQAGSVIALFEDFHSITDLSPLERALFERAGEKGDAALVVVRTRKGETDEAVVGLFDYLREHHPRHEIIERTLYLLPLVVSRWGAEAAQAIVDWIDEFDGRLMTAGGRMAQG